MLFEPRTKDEIKSVYKYFQSVGYSFWANYAYLEKQIDTFGTPLENPKWRVMEMPNKEVPAGLWISGQPNNENGDQYCTTVCNLRGFGIGLNDESCDGIAKSVICMNDVHHFTE